MMKLLYMNYNSSEILIVEIDFYDCALANGCALA